MSSKPPVVILGSDCLTGLQASRILWRRGVPVIGVADDPGSAYCRTRAAQETHDAARIVADPSALLQDLRSSYGVRPVVQACTDEFAWWLNDHREVVGEHADHLLPPSQTLQLLGDKARFYRYAIEHDLPLPETRFARSQPELNRIAAAAAFPLLIKPPRRTARWMQASGHRKVLKIESARELLQRGPALLAAAGELIIQRWIPGPDANMHSLYFCFARDSRPLGWIVAQKLRQWPPAVGVGSLAVETQAENLVDVGHALLESVGYVGPGSIQFKKDAETGEFFIIEANVGRPTLNYPLFEACGVEMTYTCYCAAAGLALPARRTVSRPGGKWVCWKTDLASAFTLWKRGELTVRAWAASLRGAKWSADVQLDDPLPLLANIARQLRLALPSFARRAAIARPRVLRTDG